MRVVGREHKSGQPSTPGSSTPTTPHDDPGEPLSGGGRPRLQRRRSSASLLVDLELWLSLEVGNATGGVARITRSMTQFLELQQELAKEFAGYSPSALEEAMSSASLTKKSADSKMELLQLLLDGLGVHSLLRECAPVQRFLSPAFDGYGPATEELVPLMSGGVARVTKAGPVVKLDAVCEELERVRRSGTVLLDEMFERQRRRTHLEDFAAAALLWWCCAPASAAASPSQRVATR